MVIFSSDDDLLSTLSLSSPAETPSVELVKKHIFSLAATFVFTNDIKRKDLIATIINNAAKTLQITPSSLFPLYRAIGRKEFEASFTVPAINMRTLTFDTAVLLFTLMKKHAIGPLIFEIAKSEMGYTNQRPKEYATVILAAAIQAGYQGPVFIQGDHFQLNADNFQTDPAKEVSSIEKLIDESLSSQFYNIDIDASTLVDLTVTNLSEQQKHNSHVTAHLTQFLRRNQPDSITVAIGGEIGHIGGKNSTTEDFLAFITDYQAKITGEGIAKVSVQTGSSHGGIPLPDGTIQDVSIDFSVLSSIGALAKETYHLAGAVQHGASTLPLSLFDQFPKHETIEIHLATGFQNTVYETIPNALREQMYDWIRTNLKEEKTENQSEDQFLYKTRKKALGPFKKELWSLRNEEKEPILQALATQFEHIFERLNIYQTRKRLDMYYNA